MKTDTIADVLNNDTASYFCGGVQEIDNQYKDFKFIIKRFIFKS